ncbi:hypothetical protein [Oenococcus sp.]|uniref:hypothetical protein n=1 Tax=Oenococcus sp. TaxID=1979414 RepID=UPI0039EC0DC8
MTELSRLACLLLDKQEKDGIPSGASFEKGLLFSEQHGYGDLARQVIKAWDSLPLGEGESLRPTRHRSAPVMVLRNQCLALWRHGNGIYEIQQQTGLSAEVVANYLGGLAPNNK